MKKILIIAGDFLPYSPSLGGVIRILTLAEFLNKNGYEINIISSKSIDFGYFGYEDKIKNFKINYIGNKLQSYILKNAKDKKTYLNQNSEEKKSLKTLFKKISLKLKYKLKNIVYEFAVPDINIFMVNKFYKTAKRLIIENQIENVLISSPPHSIQITGYKLKKHFKDKINLITDYRDSWNTVSLYTKKNPISCFLSKYYEKKVLKNCDYFTFVSNPMLPKVEKLFNINIKNKSSLVMNGFTEEINEIIQKNNDAQIKIGYFGSISDSPNSTRNISNIFIVLLKYPEELSFLQLHFFGDVTISHFDLKKLPAIHIHDSLPHKKALTEMLKMDYLLVVHSDKKSSDEVITGKFFEYVSAKKIIITLGPEDMEAKRLTQKYNVGININIDDINDIKNKLLSLKKFNKSDFYKNIDIGIFKRDFQYASFLRILR